MIFDKTYNQGDLICFAYDVSLMSEAQYNRQQIKVPLDC